MTQLGLFALARGGVFHAPDVAVGAVRSYRTISPLPRTLAGRSAVSSLWHCPEPFAWLVAVCHHRVLPCPDFPRPDLHRRAITYPHMALYDATDPDGKEVAETIHLIFCVLG